MGIAPLHARRDQGCCTQALPARRCLYVFSLQVINVEGEANKVTTLKSLLEAVPGLTVVFCETKRAADQLEHALVMAKFPATSIHGDRSQDERERALKTFKNGQAPPIPTVSTRSP